MHDPLPMHNGRRDMARELGVKFELLRQAAHDECRRNEGAIGALSQAEECLNAEIVRWSRQAKDGVVDLAESHAARERIDECAGTVRNLKMAAEHNLLAQRGKAAQAEAALDACQAAFDAEGEAIQTVAKAALEDAEQAKSNEPVTPTLPIRRQTGEHPGPSVAARRKAKAP